MEVARCSYSSSRVTRRVTSRITPYIPYPPITSEKSSGFSRRLTETTLPSARSSRKLSTTSTNWVTSISRPCALALSVPPTVKMFDDCMTLRAKPRGAIARCTSSQVAPLSTVMVIPTGSISRIRLKLRMSSTRPPGV